MTAVMGGRARKKRRATQKLHATRSMQLSQRYDRLVEEFKDVVVEHLMLMICVETRRVIKVESDRSLS